MNPKIGDCSLTAASDRWSVFCFTTATSLPRYPVLTRLHGRRVWSGEVCAGENLLWSAWLICVDLKMVNFVLGQQSGFTKYPCFLCMCDGRDTAQRYTKKDWPAREELVPCRARNIINNPLVDRDKILYLSIYLSILSSSAWLNSSPKLYTRMVAASLICAMLFQD